MGAAPIVAILEDDADSAEALALIVSDWGAETIRATTAAAVLQALGGRDLGWIIADFNIEDCPNGVDAAAALLAARPGARVLILTGTFHQRGEEAARAAGHDVMFKPARADDIVAWLARAP